MKPYDSLVTRAHPCNLLLRGPVSIHVEPWGDKSCWAGHGPIGPEPSSQAKCHDPGALKKWVHGPSWAVSVGIGIRDRHRHRARRNQCMHCLELVPRPNGPRSRAQMGTGKNRPWRRPRLSQALTSPIQATKRQIIVLLLVGNCRGSCCIDIDQDFLLHVHSAGSPWVLHKIIK